MKNCLKMLLVLIVTLLVSILSESKETELEEDVIASVDSNDEFNTLIE